MSATVLRFPGMGPSEPRPSRAPAPVPALDLFDADQARALASILERAQAKADILVGVVHSHRDLASGAGIEGIALEILTIQGSERFVRVKGALEEAVRAGTDVTLTHEGLGKLHRLEALVAEGEQQLSRFTGNGGASLSGRRLAQASSSSTDLLFFGTIFVLGAVAITLAVALVGNALPGRDRSRRPYFS